VQDPGEGFQRHRVGALAGRPEANHDSRRVITGLVPVAGQAVQGQAVLRRPGDQFLLAGALGGQAEQSLQAAAMPPIRSPGSDRPGPGASRAMSRSRRRR
jgi:hypothetical protein